MEEKAMFRWYVWPWGLGVTGDSHGWFYVGWWKAQPRLAARQALSPRSVDAPFSSWVERAASSMQGEVGPLFSHLNMMNLWLTWWYLGEMEGLRCEWCFRHLGDFMWRRWTPSTYNQPACSPRSVDTKLSSQEKRASTNMQGEARVASTCLILMAMSVYFKRIWYEMIHEWFHVGEAVHESNNFIS